MPSNTTYDPQSVADFQKSKLNYAAKGVSKLCPPGLTTDLDLVLTDDTLITGAWVISLYSNFGDTASFQVVDPSGAITGTPGGVVKTFIEEWLLVGNVNINMDMPYPAKIPAGLAIRLSYTNTGSLDVNLAINWKLHKVLV